MLKRVFKSGWPSGLRRQTQVKYLSHDRIKEFWFSKEGVGSNPTSDNCFFIIVNWFCLSKIKFVCHYEWYSDCKFAFLVPQYFYQHFFYYKKIHQPVALICQQYSLGNFSCFLSRNFSHSVNPDKNLVFETREKVGKVALRTWRSGSRQIVVLLSYLHGYNETSIIFFSLISMFCTLAQECRNYVLHVPTVLLYN